jgi:hypothetical protein
VVGAGHAPQRLAELGVLEALFDLRAVAMEVLDCDRRVLGDVGGDEAVAVGALDLPAGQQRELIGMDPLRRRAAVLVEICAAP